MQKSNSGQTEYLVVKCMPKEERGVLITAIYFKKGYGLTYLEGLSDEGLIKLYDQLFGE